MSSSSIGFGCAMAVSIVSSLAALAHPTSCFSIPRRPSCDRRRPWQHRSSSSPSSSGPYTNSGRRRPLAAVGGGSTLAATTASPPPTSPLGDEKRLKRLAQIANDALDAHGSDVLRTFDARVGVVASNDNDDDDDDFQKGYLRLGLIAAESFRKDDQLVAALPYYDTDGSGLALAPHLATKVVYRDVLPEGYDGWTGDAGLLAMLLLNEMARSNVDAAGGDAEPRGIDLPKRKDGPKAMMGAWVSTLPSPDEMAAMHPLMWGEDDQETLQSSSTKKIYRLLDDVDDDSSWLDERLWSEDRERFPETVRIRVGDDEVEERPCFSPAGFRYAVSLVRSRSSFVDGSSRLLPYLDYANHDDYDSYELVGGGIGTLWGSAKGALLKSGKALNVGDEVRISYGPKGPADYLLDHGFVPPMCRMISEGGRKGGGGGSAVAAELSFEVSEADRFRDDKLDVLEYETYDLAPMEPLQTFDVAGGPGSTGEPDPAMMQFLRLAHLGGKDAFLLESIFRKEIWGFMSEPVSEDNERGAVGAVIEACRSALGEMDEVAAVVALDASEKGRLCSMVGQSERDALERTLAYVRQEAEALDLKEYYQVRRLKSLGLDSDWTPEDDVGFGGTRVPGGADYDW
eukprot:CAMPEP_0181133386 /NCGR_PEP_ID=MMETSP1071-20121207/31505_1 /TAXON_ID=35127 /ORGANISM="Thalassiosira sp., Strain NH16" /LENGTH=626 /DNA_ID=CAMNT_0023219791 /DNA_START=97 /DNA_END=1977 /DNA_ORIENTATION=-